MPKGSSSAIPEQLAAIHWRIVQEGAGDFSLVPVRVANLEPQVAGVPASDPIKRIHLTRSRSDTSKGIPKVALRPFREIRLLRHLEMAEGLFESNEALEGGHLR